MTAAGVRCGVTVGVRCGVSPDDSAGGGATVPDAPTIGTAVAGDAQISVAFTANGDGGSAITQFTVTLEPGGATQTGASSPIVIAATNGVEYTASVTADNAIGTSDPSAASNAVTPWYTAPWLLSDPPVDVITWDADDVTLVGGKVSGAVGALGVVSFSQGTDAMRPVWSATALARHPRAVFAGAEILTSTTSALANCFAGNDTPYGIVLACNHTAASAQRRWVAAQVGDSLTGSNQIGIGTTASGAVTVNKGAATLNGASQLASGTHMIAHSCAGTTSEMRVDGSSAASGATDDSSRAIDTVRIGGQITSGPTLGRAYTGDIGVTAFYSRALDGTDFTRWSNYTGLTT